MSPALEEALFHRYPDLLGAVAERTREQRRYGCVHRDGWYALVDAICDVLSARARAIGEWPTGAVQLGHRLEGVRFYAHLPDDEQMFEAVSMAELHSKNLCEITGGPGRLTRAGDWYGTMSPKIALGRCRFVTADTPPLPPLNVDETTNYLVETWSSTIRCVPRIPGGWLDLVSTMVAWISERRQTDPDHDVAIDQLHQRDGELVVSLRQIVVADQGSVAFAKAMARRTDPMTGQTAVLR
jgi:hypothetical protein